MKHLVVAGVAILFAGGATAQTSNSSSGSGIAIGEGAILTNWHVVNGCSRIAAKVGADADRDAVLVARDEHNDLAVVGVKVPLKSVAVFRQGASIRAGEMVLASGYPLSGLLASTANISTGIVNALAGLSNDSRFFQISTPVQPGNSGGPLVDQAGHVVGIVTGKLNAVAVARFTGDIPQNVNFAIKGEVARTFLESQGIKYTAANSDQQLSLPDLADLAKSFAAYIECRGGSPEPRAGGGSFAGRDAGGKATGGGATTGSKRFDVAKLNELMALALAEPDETPLSRPAVLGLGSEKLTTKSIERTPAGEKYGFMVIIPRREDGLIFFHGSDKPLFFAIHRTGSRLKRLASAINRDGKLEEWAGADADRDFAAQIAFWAK
jgi:Trypsin-like peptidase domain